MCVMNVDIQQTAMLLPLWWWNKEVLQLRDSRVLPACGGNARRGRKSRHDQRSRNVLPRGWKPALYPLGLAVGGCHALQIVSATAYSQNKLFLRFLVKEQFYLCIFFTARVSGCAWRQCLRYFYPRLVVKASNCLLLSKFSVSL